MRLSVKADSKCNIGYTPDWLKVSYKEDGNDMELTLDIQGEINYDKNGLDCYCKGNLVPWTLFNQTSGEEQDLSELSDEEVNKTFSQKRIMEILSLGTSFVVGVYPVDDSEKNAELASKDVLSNGTGSCELYYDETFRKVYFEFEVDLNK